MVDSSGCVLGCDDSLLDEESIIEEPRMRPFILCMNDLFDESSPDDSSGGPG